MNFTTFLPDIRRMAVLAGLEPTTRCLEGSCSIQMSYRTCVKNAEIL